MTLFDILLHLLNFVAPAFALAVLLPLLTLVLMGKRGAILAWKGQILVNLVVGLATLFGALWWLGRDGKMTGYAMLVVAVASSQWLLLRGWRH